MSGRDKFSVFLLAWLEEQPDRAPDGLVERVLADLGVTPQRKRWTRFLFVRRGTTAAPARLAAVLGLFAMVLALALGAWWGWGSRVGGPAPGGTPTTSQTPSGSPTVVRGAAPLPPGDYVVDSVAVKGLSVSFAIPPGAAGWESGGSNYVGKPPFTEPPDGLMLAFNVVTAVVPDPCQAIGFTTRIGATVEDFARAMAAVPRAAVDGPNEIQVDGYRGLHVGLTVDDDLSGCYIDGLGLYSIPFGPAVRMVGSTTRVDFWILDVDGVRLVIEASYHPGSTAADLVELEMVLDSLSIAGPDPAPTAP